MSSPKHLELPPALQPYRETLEKTVRPSIHITARRGNPSLFQSKFGGYPYLPRNAEHPKDEHGEPMMLLAQLNFEELPRLDYLPAKGILQFFIAYGDDVYGLDFDDQTNQKNFRTVYYPEVVQDEALLVTDFAYLDEADDEMAPFTGEYALSFELTSEAISMPDYRFDQVTAGLIDLDQKVEVDGKTTDMWSVCSDYLSGFGHKIGGYPTFTQTDPRHDDNEYAGYEILLLQIDTDYSEKDGTDIMWGDAGVANFFIKEEDLRQLNFSKVLYNWDCS
ncbi:YwqG family protein [Brevibacillus dissolubilis]|uniref:YwqG family protein n=1 Tax=Brevibacillus dissolubilis TaxID=1844116 RepID=UPI001116CAE7|nr:YwqG family protein [Brevibacillus dissolubilis]